MKRLGRQLFLAAGFVGLAIVLQILFARFGHGLITPEGSVSFGVAVLGAGMVATRLVVLFGAPLWAGMTLALLVFDFARSRGSKASGTGRTPPEEQV